MSMSALGNISGPNRPLGKTIAGVLSGAAANIRSRFSNLSAAASGGTLSSESPSPPPLSHAPTGLSSPRQQQASERRHGEQVSPSALPMTVPGAAVYPAPSYPPVSSSCPFSKLSFFFAL